MMLKCCHYGSCLALVASTYAFAPLSRQLHRIEHRTLDTMKSNIPIFSSADEDILSGSSGGRINSAFSRNEFSRVIYIDRIFQQRGRNNQQRDHEVKIRASDEECQALADRFELKKIETLEARLSIRPATEALAAGTSGGGLPVEAEGTIEAHLTQTCVRTNEEFEVDVEFPVYLIVKPVTSNNKDDIELMIAQQQEEEEAEGGKKKKKKKKFKPKKDDVFHQNKKTYNLSDIFDLQSAIQEADFGGAGDGLADTVEDEAIYSLSSDQLDVGELIAQTFCLELDPYPKKPGTDPVSWEITG
ncbi:unnamed protein product [Pseudo-nitzschia multistriata]|uniref:Uncharacterized protein n=1 Tax=Pseudo-nitzschia multistriata TaxID=183589 RepID=A0A448ZI77_9STRA|nr:unnamed protein product [Pseudo-nitzschia multistriata]